MYLSEGWKRLFLRYKTDMHKSINDFSKEGIDRAQKGCVVLLLCVVPKCGPAGIFWDTLICLIPFFPRGGVGSVCFREKHILNYQTVPTRAVCPEQLLALLWEVEGVSRKEVGAGADAGREMATQPMRAVPRPSLCPCSC